MARNKINWTVVLVKMFDMLKMFFKYLFIFLAIKELAGKYTYAELPFLKEVFTEKTNETLYWIIIFATVLWAIAERWFRHYKTSYMQTRITELEKRIDPRRTSSQLTQKGKTNPKDR